MDSLCLAARPAKLPPQATWATPAAPISSRLFITAERNRSSFMRSRLGGCSFVMLEIILDSLVPIFFGMGLGYVAGWTRDIDNKHVGELNALVMDFALPAAIFGAVAQQSRGHCSPRFPSP